MSFMSGRVFVDTNTLVYAYDADAAEKRQIARRLIASLWGQKSGVLSRQVLQEFYVVTARKMAAPIRRLDARTVVRAYLPWVIETDAAMILAASEIEERNNISFWGAMIVAAAQRARAVRIVTEDLNHGQQIEGIVIENPFLGL